MTTQDENKKAAARAALKYLPKNDYIGVGTGSTVNFLIEALKDFKDEIKGAVATSEMTAALLKKAGIPLVSLNEVSSLPVYFDGADEVNSLLQMIKGGGGALLAEKIVASGAKQFVCIADGSKYVRKLGQFPVPVEVLPYARSLVARRLAGLGGQPELRLNFVTESGNQILDTRNLDLSRPLELEQEINHIPGVVENGIFAKYPANILLLGKAGEVETKTIGALF